MFWVRRPMMGRVASGVGLTFTFQASAVSNSDTITVPASVLDDDLGILLDIGTNGASEPSAVTPTNWTNRHNDVSGSTIRAMMHTKLLTTAEASSTVTGMNATSDEKVLLVFRPSRAIGSITASTVNSQITTSNPTLQTVTALGQPSPLIVIGVAAVPGGGTAAFSTQSPAFDATVATGDSDMIVGYKTYNSAPQTHSIDMGDLTVDENALVSFFLRFT